MSKKRVLVLGAGLIGRPMALDLQRNDEFQVSVVDISSKNLSRFEGSNIQCHQADFREPSSWFSLTESHDYFINAVPGFIGFSTLKALISTGKPIIDIAFYPEDPLTLDDLAKKHQSTVVCDMGVAPGMSHLLSGYAASMLDHIERLVIYVGGLPVLRQLPWQYKAVFSPSDVIEEYTRPARLVENGKIVIKEALSDAEFLDFDGVGTLEAFNSDGLRSLVYTMKADFMAEKTLRYPGHIDLIKALKKSGFFSEEAISIHQQNVVPLDFTKTMLFDQWKLNDGEADLTVMRIEAQGTTANKQKSTISFDLFDKPDVTGGIHSMARTTGYAATSALRMIHQGLLDKPGIHMPEFLGKDETIVQFMLSDQSQRGINYKKTILMH